MRITFWLPLALGGRHYLEAASRTAATRGSIGRGGDFGWDGQGGQAWQRSMPSYQHQSPRVRSQESAPTADARVLASLFGGTAMVVLLALRPLRSAMAATQAFEGELPPSHKDVELSGGLPVENKFHFVDEPTCIGCTWCADVARNTFYMEGEQGLGRVFRQHGDSLDIIEEAMACCPVNAIVSVTWEQLVSSESRREEQSRLSGHLYHLPGKGLLRARSHAESRGHVIVGRATTDDEEREQEKRTSKLKEEKRRALAEELSHADVLNLDSLLDTIVNDPCEHDDASECMLASDPCAASPYGDGCATMTAPVVPLNPAMFETYAVQDPCEVAPSSEECQVLTSARDEELVGRIDHCDMDDLNCEVFDPCGVADAPFACEHDGEVEKRIADMFNHVELSAV